MFQRQPHVVELCFRSSSGFGEIAGGSSEEKEVASENICITLAGIIKDVEEREGRAGKSIYDRRFGSGEASSAQHLGGGDSQEGEE